MAKLIDKLNIKDSMSSGLGVDASPEENAVGIDFGTTNSLIAICRDGVVEVIRDYITGDDYIASQVSLDGKLVGSCCGDSCIKSVKRLFTSRDSADSGAASDVSPVFLASKIFERLRLSASKYLGYTPVDSVITVPAYFDESARSGIKKAAELAGFKALRIIAEPTAAALYYSLEKSKEGLYAVYDLGGGTFDVSILRMQKGFFQVLGVSGDPNLGGDDFDALLNSHLTEHFNADVSADISRIKHHLTDDNSYNCASSGISISREKFERLADPLVACTIAAFDNVLQDVAIDEKELLGIILVGGATRMPMIRKKLEQRFKDTPILSDVHPETAVVSGAAIQAENLSIGLRSTLVDVVPLSLGIELLGGVTEKIIERNSPIPISKKKVFTNQVEGQSSIRVHVVQGEHESVALNRSLCVFDLPIPRFGSMSSKVEVTFTIDVDGLLTVSAVELESGVKQELSVKPAYGLDRAKVSKLLE